MTWGSLWSSLWGGAGSTECGDLLYGRALEQITRDAPANLRRLFGLIGSYCDNYTGVATSIIDSLSIDTGTGSALDTIGAIIDLPRNGYADADYRRLLKVQQELLLSYLRDDGQWAGTIESIIRMVQAFAPGAMPVITNVPPYSFTISVPGLSQVDIATLFGFIKRALYAGVYGAASFGDDGMGSTVGPIPGELIMGSTVGPIPGEGEMGTVITTYP